jgi:hypothetical protein
MSQEHGRDDVTWDINANLSPYLHRFVKVVAAHTVGLCGLGQRAIGVLKNQPDNLKIKSAAVRQYNAGVSTKVVAGGAVAAGVAVTSDANGKAIAAGAGQAINGYAREAAALDGDIIEISLAAGGLA